MVLATIQTGYCLSPSGRCWRGISRMVFFLSPFLSYIPCLSLQFRYFFWQIMSNIINNIVCVMPKLFLWLGVSSFGGSYVYPVALLDKSHCQEDDWMSPLTHKAWRASLKLSYVRNWDMPRVPWNSSKFSLMISRFFTSRLLINLFRDIFCNLLLCYTLAS